MQKFPSGTKFYVNAWTPGYEVFLQAVAEAFHTQVSLSRATLVFKPNPHLLEGTCRSVQMDAVRL